MSPNFRLNFGYNKLVNVYIKLNKQMSNRDKYIKKILDSGYTGTYLLSGMHIYELNFGTNMKRDEEDDGRTQVTLGFTNSTEPLDADFISNFLLSNCTQCNKLTLCEYDSYVKNECFACGYDGPNHILYYDFIEPHTILTQWHTLIKNDETKLKYIDHREIVMDINANENTYSTLISLE